jgi:hypothetical protein
MADLISGICGSEFWVIIHFSSIFFEKNLNYEFRIQTLFMMRIQI